MKDFYDEGTKIGEVKFDKVLVATNLKRVDDTLLNRCLQNGIEIIAIEDKENNKVKYAGVRRLKKELSKDGIAWKVGGGIIRFWNKVAKVCSEFDMAKS